MFLWSLHYLSFIALLLLINPFVFSNFCNVLLLRKSRPSDSMSVGKSRPSDSMSCGKSRPSDSMSVGKSRPSDSMSVE